MESPLKTEVFYKVEVEVEPGDWVGMERVEPLQAQVPMRRHEILVEAAESYRKPVRIVKVDRTITVVETLQEEVSQ